jgi:hypothetical protein
VTRASCLALLAVAACSFPRHQCIARGASTKYTGSASYDGQVSTAPGAPTPLTGSIAADVVVDDFTPDCNYDAMEFTLSVGASCALRATLGVSTYERSGTFIGATATIAPGQDCVLVLGADTGRLAVESGVLSIQGGGVTHVEIAGTVTVWNGQMLSGHLDWRFDGA